MLQIKVDHAGNPSAGGRLGTGFIIILGTRSHKRHGDVGMRIYRPGKNVFSLGINNLISRIVQIATDSFDFIAIGKHVGLVTAGGVYDGTSLK